jgi:hypothetical protein
MIIGKTLRLLEKFEAAEPWVAGTASVQAANLHLDLAILAQPQKRYASLSVIAMGFARRSTHPTRHC